MQCNVMSNSIINNQQQFDLFVSKFASKHKNLSGIATSNFMV